MYDIEYKNNINKLTKHYTNLEYKFLQFVEIYNDNYNNPILKKRIF